MDDALGPGRQTLRADSAPRARREEPARPKTAVSKASEPSRRPASASRDAKKADRRDDDGDADKGPGRTHGKTSGDAAPVDQSVSPRAEAKKNGDATDATATPEGEGAEAAAVADAAHAVVADSDAKGATPPADGEAAGTTDAGDPMARGRRWTSSSDRAGEQSGAVPTGVGRRGPAATGLAVKAGHAVQQARAEGAAIPGQPLAEVAKAVVADAHADGNAEGGPKTAPAPQAVEASTQKAGAASTPDAIAAMENAASGIEAVAAATTTGADTNTAGSQTHEQPPQKLPAPGAESNAATVVAAATPADGVRFAVTGAAGNAAYANAAPRGEEAMLPQIVQSIRLHAVQGTTEARVQLKPEHLGALNITLKVEQNQVTATIQADVPAVRAWIESNESSLRQALSEQGLQLAKLVVQEDGQHASKEEQGGERQQRQPRRRSWRDAEATFEVVA